jgi:hypothetical protein
MPATRTSCASRPTAAPASTDTPQSRHASLLPWRALPHLPHGRRTTLPPCARDARPCRDRCPALRPASTVPRPCRHSTGGSWREARRGCGGHAARKRWLPITSRDGGSRPPPTGRPQQVAAAMRAAHRAPTPTWRLPPDSSASQPRGNKQSWRSAYHKIVRSPSTCGSPLVGGALVRHTEHHEVG